MASLEQDNEKAKLLLKKIKLKEQFDADHDEEAPKGVTDNINIGEDEKSDDFFTKWKADLAKQQELLKTEFATVDPETRVKMEGILL